MKYLKWLCIFIISLYSCQNIRSKFIDVKGVESDSISLWLKNGRDDEKPKEERLENLTKAYQNLISLQNDSLRIKDLLLIVDEYYSLKEYSLFNNSNEFIYKIALKVNDTPSVAEYHWNKGTILSENEVLDSAYYHYDKASFLYGKIEDELYFAKMEFNKSYVMFRVKNYVQSEIFVFNAIKIYKKLKKNKELYLCYNRLLLLDKEIGNFDEALDHYEKAKFYLDKIDNKSYYIERSLNNLSLVYQKQGKYDLAIDALNRALENKDLQKLNYNLYAKIIDNRAYCQFLQGDTFTVLDDFNRALAMRQELKNEAGVVISNLHLAEYYLKFQDRKKAHELATEAHEIADRLQLNRDILNSLELLSVTDPDNAYVYMGRYAALNDSLQQEERMTRNKFTRIQYETEGYIAANKELQQKNIWVSLSSVLTLGSLILLFFSYFQRSKNKNLMLERQQQTANEEIYNLMLKQQSKTEEGRIQERVRISEELHDGVLAKLFSVRIGMGFLNLKGQKNDEKQYHAFMDELQSVEKEIRLISHALKNDDLSSKEDFPILLQELLEEQSALGGFAFHVEWDDSIAWDRVPDKIKINLYRIAQEAVYNIIKHAACEQVEMHLRKKSNLVELLITDNGKGFDLEKKRKGIGLKNMRSRSGSIGAGLDISSSVEAGTTIKITIPTKILYHDQKA